jgi:hypothetical protein
MYLALTRAREKLLISPACVEAISASTATQGGSALTGFPRVLRTRLAFGKSLVTGRHE